MPATSPTWNYSNNVESCFSSTIWMGTMLFIAGSIISADSAYKHGFAFFKSRSTGAAIAGLLTPTLVLGLLIAACVVGLHLKSRRQQSKENVEKVEEMANDKLPNESRLHMNI
jgi:hypothetical protein